MEGCTYDRTSKHGESSLREKPPKIQSLESETIEHRFQLESKNEANDDRITIGFLKELLNAQDYKCALTGRELTPENVELDHKESRAIGGQHTRDNLHLVVSEANQAKRAMPLREFIRLCHDVAKTHPLEDD